MIAQITVASTRPKLSCIVRCVIRGYTGSHYLSSQTSKTSTAVSLGKHDKNAMCHTDIHMQAKSPGDLAVLLDLPLLAVGRAWTVKSSCACIGKGVHSRYSWQIGYALTSWRHCRRPDVAQSLVDIGANIRTTLKEAFFLLCLADLRLLSMVTDKSVLQYGFRCAKLYHVVDLSLPHSCFFPFSFLEKKGQIF